MVGAVEIVGTGLRGYHAKGVPGCQVGWILRDVVAASVGSSSSSPIGFLSQIRTKLRDMALGPVKESCHS